MTHYSTDSLLNPDTNIELGTHYFREMVDHFGRPGGVCTRGLQRWC